MAIKVTSYTELSRLHRAVVGEFRGTLLLTASQDSEGTTLVAHLLALKSAENGMRTLLIDLNLRDTTLSKELGLERKQWDLSLKRPEQSMKFFTEPAKSQSNLSYLAAPTDEASVAHLRDVDNARTFFSTLGQDFDQIIVDTSPISAHNRGNVDPALLAAAAGRTVLVVLANMTPRERIKRAIRILKQAGAHIEGVVVNDKFNPSPRQQLLKCVDVLFSWNLGLNSFLRHKIMSARLPL